MVRYVMCKAHEREHLSHVASLDVYKAFGPGEGSRRAKGHAWLLIGRLRAC